ncbi:asparagine synthase (glutamine-hydrolyzing) [Chitinivorax tropicus]|uniref:asparagine synthase (glutamine-hydrolyzing) n=1 Tax=Chitinivorax tropicus TaxID=714531 RepID=A0A840MN43_9PROT|nr:XrtA/PEP-CTERM system amidotransferase [Chitinivorax tropicus]MBB5018885.1 asparagine synthase (glutamine-hydrolyzing) [Chitinivorax tropicus]
MCGIVGLFDLKGRRVYERELVSRLNDIQYHRGPDESGLHIEPGVAFGHRRLSIIDLSTGQQPLFNEDRSVVVVFNGEIYNFQELMPELQALGHTFRTHSDTEVIVHAWEEWGEACVQRFRGMFAFALWDRNRDILFLARDRLGVKPLFYALLPDGTMMFSSELKSIAAHPAFDKVLDPMSIEDYFAYGYIPEPRTVYLGASKLEPGHTLTFRHGGIMPEPREYWDVPFKSIGPISEKEAEEEMIRRLRDSVRIRMISEVPLGAFLSGGVDSSAVVAMMAGLSSDPVNTCSISFGDPKFNEAEFAQQVANRYHTNHRVEQVDPDDFSLLDKLAGMYDEPYADSSALPTYRVCQLARKHVTVALSGDGGDENVAGYRRYRFHLNEEKLRSALPLSIRRPLFGTLGTLYPKADWAPRMFRAKSTFEALARDSVEAYFHAVSIFKTSMRAKLYTPKFMAELGGYHASNAMRRHAQKAPTDHPLSLVQYLDMKTYLVGDILTKVDRASMANSLEVREPLLDHSWMEWMSGLPPELKLKGGEGKYILKKSLEPYLPNDILYRQKMGFAVPLAAWFRGPLRQRVREALLGDTLAQTGWFNQSYLLELVTHHEKGIRDYSAPIWTLLMFESFLRNCLGVTASDTSKVA